MNCFGRGQGFLAAAAWAAFVLAASQATAEFTEFRSTFLDRFDYVWNSGDIPQMTLDIQNQIQAAKNEGFTQVVWQVRGRGDALYNSNVEPAALNLTPGFDPLQVAIDAAHANGLKLHAWINTTPMWNLATISPPPGHMFYNNNPSFRLMDINGNLEPQQGYVSYSIANPVLPEMHAHINNVVRDIAENYEVDGVNLDYIRYVPGTTNFNRLPHDPISHQMFQQATGLDGADPANAAPYKTFIAGRITDLVRSIKQTVDQLEISEGREILLSADVWRDADVGLNDYMQDYRTWIQESILDVAMPMIYLSASNDHIFFDNNLSKTLAIKANSGSITLIAPTLASYLHVNPNGGGVDLTLSQIHRAFEGYGLGGADGIGLYDYPAFFGDGYSDADRQRIKNYFNAIAPAEPGPGDVIEDFAADQGRFHWAYNTAGNPHTFGLANSTTFSRVTNETQSGAGAQLLDIDANPNSSNWLLRHYSGAATAGDPTENALFAATGRVGLWLKTDDAGVLVRIGIDDPTTAAPSAVERGVAQQVIGDNQWHLYQWNLLDEFDWEAYSGGADGFIDGESGMVSIDSIWFAGTGNVELYLDTISHNPLGPISGPINLAGDFDGNGSVGPEDYDAWRAAYGQSAAGGGSASAAGGPSGTDAAGYVLWRKMMSLYGGSAALTGAPAVPEPSSVLLLLAAAAGLLGIRPRT